MGVNGSGLNDCPLNVATLSILYNPCLEASRAKQRAGASMQPRAALMQPCTRWAQWAVSVREDSWALCFTVQCLVVNQMRSHVQCCHFSAFLAIFSSFLDPPARK